MASPRFLVETALHAGARVTLDAARSRHVGVVLRLGLGDDVRVFNARDGEWRASIEAKDRRGVTVQPRERLRAAAPTPDLDLLFAPVKRQGTNLIVEKATELGVARIFPVITQRTIAETVRVERLALIAREAVEQTERFDAPRIFAPQPLARILDGWDSSRPLLFADEAGHEGGDRARAAPILDTFSPPPLRGEGAGVGVSRDASATAPSPTPDPAMSSLTPPPHPLPSKGRGRLALLIGPEGGFSGEERRMLRALSFVTPVSLGPRILRAETAVIGALAVIQAAWGDWGEEARDE